jgi:hypothetical protein
MSKRFIVLLVAAVALVLASTASAATITQAPGGPGYQNLAPYTNPNTGACSGQSGTYSLSGAPIRLQFGWGAKTEAQMAGFFKNSNGTVTIIYDTTPPTTVFSDSWSSTSGAPFRSVQGIQWSALAPQTLQYAPGNATVQGFSSSYRGTLSGLTVGSYTLTQTYTFNKPVQDGFNVYQGTMTSTCTFTVVA